MLSKLRWSLPPVTAADYLGALMPFFPTNRGKLQTNLLEFLINKLIFMPYHEINSKLQTQHSTMLLPVEVHQQPHFSQCCPLLMNSSVFPPHSPLLLRGVGRSADARPLPPLDPTAVFLSILFEPLAAMSNAVKPPSGHLSITEERRRRATEKAGQKREQGGGRAQAGTLSGNL